MCYYLYWEYFYLNRCFVPFSFPRTVKITTICEYWPSLLLSGNDTALPYEKCITVQRNLERFHVIYTPNFLFSSSFNLYTDNQRMLSWGKTHTEPSNCCTHISDATYWILPPYSETHTQMEIRKVLGIICSIYHLCLLYSRKVWWTLLGWLTQQVSSIAFSCLPLTTEAGTNEYVTSQPPL